MATRVEPKTTVGQALPSLVKDVSQRRIDTYSGVKPSSIHTDEAWARKKGFRTCLAQGMMSMAFIKPVYAGDRLTVHGVVKDKQSENGATRVDVEVWVENQHGEKTAVGHATGLVS